ncbi:ketopantoate reductase family protein [Cnuibacter sp. UC19_7]|uniref:ketopantoate reductase family protein n=1 Tax=Cnuibacter sp. UC19_7 TaxID=3350166 RepID=UPI00366F881B
MTIAVIGAGAIGGTVAAALDRAGHDVVVTARGEHLDAIRRDGLLLTGGWGDHRAHLTAQERLDERPDLAIIAVKAQDADRAVADNAEALRGTDVLVIQNGLGGAERVAAALPGSAVLGGLALYAASFLSPGSVAITTPGPTILGAVDHRKDAAVLDRVAATLGSAVPITTTTNLVGAQWTKLIVNQVNALPAITGMSVQDVVRVPVLRQVMTASMREAVVAARARGVRFEPMSGLGEGLLTVFSMAPLRWAEMLPKLMARRMGATPNPGSTLQSIRRGQPTEIDHLNGAVVSEGRVAGLPTPVNERLVALVHEVERTGRFVPPARVPRAVFRRL